MVDDHPLTGHMIKVNATYCFYTVSIDRESVTLSRQPTEIDQNTLPVDDRPLTGHIIKCNAA